jgi:hypothetical protein
MNDFAGALLLLGLGDQPGDISVKETPKEAEPMTHLF